MAVQVFCSEIDCQAKKHTFELVRIEENGAESEDYKNITKTLTRFANLRCSHPLN